MKFALEVLYSCEREGIIRLGWMLLVIVREGDVAWNFNLRLGERWIHSDSFLQGVVWMSRVEYIFGGKFVSNDDNGKCVQCL